MPHFEPKNTLQQDLFLLAKGHYGKPQVLVERLDVAKMIIGLHIGITDKHIALKDVLHWMLEEFVKTGANPFLHDHIRMGTDLTRDWIVMHEGGDSKDSPSGHQFLYLVNRRSGQRIGLRLHPQF